MREGEMREKGEGDMKETEKRLVLSIFGFTRSWLILIGFKKYFMIFIRCQKKQFGKYDFTTLFLQKERKGWNLSRF